MQHRFAVIYTFKVKPGFDEQFIQAWKDLTIMIRKHEGSRGSRLHQNSDGLYIAYAFWPDRATWENMGNKLPKGVEDIRRDMRESCELIETRYEMEVVADLLSDISE